MTAEVVYLHGRLHELPPLVTTKPEPELNRCDDPIISATCEGCRGLLAYQCGAWLHVNACLDCLHGSAEFCAGNHPACDEPEPVTCMHDGCREAADVDMQCVNGAEGECDGCCWIREDELEGRRMWPR